MNPADKDASPQCNSRVTAKVIYVRRYPYSLMIILSKLRALHISQASNEFAAMTTSSTVMATKLRTMSKFLPPLMKTLSSWRQSDVYQAALAGGVEQCFTRPRNIHHLAV